MYKLVDETMNIYVCFIKTHDSELWGQEEGKDEFTCSTAQKFADIVNKLPRQISLT